jgi:hypothetical protein
MGPTGSAISATSLPHADLTRSPERGSYSDGGTTQALALLVVAAVGAAFLAWFQTGG